MKVTDKSLYTDSVWDFGNECDIPSMKPDAKRVVFHNGPLARNPKICAMTKAYAWARRVGSDRLRGVSWTRVKMIVGILSQLSGWLEKCGKDSFDGMTHADWQCVVRSMPKARRHRDLLEELVLLSTFRQIPHGPVARPLGDSTPARIMGRVQSKQTEPIDDDMLCTLLRQCVVYEKAIPALVKMNTATVDIRCPQWDGVSGHFKTGQSWSLQNQPL